MGALKELSFSKPKSSLPIYLYHGSAVIVRELELRAPLYTKDFGTGFYCTGLLKQARRWARRKGAGHGHGHGYVSVYEYDSEQAKGLRVLKFDGMNDLWLDFVASCRYGTEHNYDIVEGPMADDDVYDHVNDFMHGVISRRQFWDYCAFKYFTHQISFHTHDALECLTFDRSIGVRSYDI